jgi:hypothetical protein
MKRFLLYENFVIFEQLEVLIVDNEQNELLGLISILRNIQFLSVGSFLES